MSVKIINTNYQYQILGYKSMLIETLKVETICATEFLHLILRDIRYLYFVISMYVSSLIDIKDARLLRAMYCLARNIDDIADDERRIDGDPRLYIQKLVYQIQKEDFDDRLFISRLAKFIFNDLALRYDCKKQVKNSLLSLINLILYDRKRAKQKLILTEEELKRHLYKTIECSLDITLKIIRSRVTAKEVSNLINAQCYLYTVRDLKKDLFLNIVNIPRNVVEQSGNCKSAIPNYRELLKSDNVKLWSKIQFEKGKFYLNKSNDILEGVSDKRIKSVLVPIMRGLKFYVLKHQRKFRFEIM